MAQQEDDNVLKVKQRDTKRYEVQDNDGHLKGSRQQGSSTEVMEKLRKEEANDTADLNKLDDRSTVGGNETV